MRRISVQITSKRNPGTIVPGYVVLHELSNEVLSFFSTKKFNHEEELEVLAEIHGSPKKYEVELSQCHEQISSGRVMTSLPVEGQALPTRTFYRCFAKILSLVSLDDVQDDGVSTGTNNQEGIAPVININAQAGAPGDGAPSVGDAAPAATETPAAEAQPEVKAA